MWRRIEWLLGAVEPRPADDSRPVAILVVVFAALALLATDQLWFRGHPMMRGPWRAALQGGIPLMAVAGWELRAQPRGRPLATLGAITLLLTFLAYGAGALPWWREHQWAFQLPCIAGCLMLLGGLSRGGWDAEAWNAGAGDWLWWGPRTAVALVALIPAVIAVVSVSPALQEFYPAWYPARTDYTLVWVSNVGGAIDLLASEWLFRGFILAGLARAGRPWLAIGSQAAPFWLLHHAKPQPEFWLALIGGVAAGWFCYRARSFWPLFVLHLAQISTLNLAAFALR